MDGEAALGSRSRSELAAEHGDPLAHPDQAVADRVVAAAWVARAVVDHFLARDEIVGMDTDFTNVIEFHARDGSKVIIWIGYATMQLQAQGMQQQIPAVAQMEAIAAALGRAYERQPAANARV